MSKRGCECRSVACSRDAYRSMCAAAILVLTQAVAMACSSQPSGLADGIAQADSLVQAAVADQLVPGAVLLVSHDGRSVFKKAYGHAQLYEYGGRRLSEPKPMTVGHVFDLASLTKVFATTLGLMRLVDEGEVDLDAPVHTYLPAFRGTSIDSITVRHLLSHTGGLFQWKPIYYHATDKDEAFDYIRSMPLAFPVGKQRRYSDLGFMLLGRIVESVAGRDLDAYLRDELYEHLRLPNIGFNPRERGLGPFAATSHGNPFERKMVYDDSFGYDVDEDPDSFGGWREYVLVGEVNDGNAYHAFEGVAGHAGLFATAGDLQILLDLLISRGVYESRRYISEAVVDSFLTPGAFGNGLGWIMSDRLLGLDDAPDGTFGHTGFTGTYALAVPAYSLGIILLTNRQNLGVGPSGRYNSVDELRVGVANALILGIRDRE